MTMLIERGAKPNLEKVKLFHTFTPQIQQRLKFIENRLFWNGRINRADLSEEFGIHNRYAANDIQKYADVTENNIVYNKRDKCYEAHPRFRPQITQPTVDNLLGYALLNQQGMLSNLHYETLPHPKNHVSSVTLSNVLAACREHYHIKIRYASFGKPETIRWVAPHAVVFDGHRWHMRAWCEKSHRFKDFNLGRVKETLEYCPAPDLETDREWNEIVSITLVPNRSATDAQKRAIESDHQMKGGELQLALRKPLVQYLFLALNLDVEFFTAHRQPLQLKDRNQLKLAPGLEQTIKQPQENPPHLGPSSSKSPVL